MARGRPRGSQGKKRLAKTADEMDAQEARIADRVAQGIANAHSQEEALMVIEILKPSQAGYRVRIDGKTHEPDLLYIVLERIQRDILQRFSR